MLHMDYVAAVVIETVLPGDEYIELTFSPGKLQTKYISVAPTAALSEESTVFDPLLFQFHFGLPHRMAMLAT